MSEDDLEWIKEARHIAGQCWCDPETSGIEMDHRLAEAFARRLAVWMQTWDQESRNAQFYRDLIDQCVDNLGPLRAAAFVSEDGSVQDTPVRLKLPELVANLSRRIS